MLLDNRTCQRAMLLPGFEILSSSAIPGKSRNPRLDVAKPCLNQDFQFIFRSRTNIVRVAFARNFCIKEKLCRCKTGSALPTVDVFVAGLASGLGGKPNIYGPSGTRAAGQIPRERDLRRNGIVVVKFFLHVSKEEQSRRFLERADSPDKNWKFSASDMAERDHWDAYQKAYEDMIRNTATKASPWYLV
jgi:hypothetical protein